VNPVARRELTERFRRPRSAVLFTLWILAVGLLGYLVYQLSRLVAQNIFGTGGTFVAAATMGRFMFESLLVLLMTGVVMVVPGGVALSIVGERERLTLPLLQVSQLSAGQVVRGKLMSSMSYVMLLLVAVAPIVALPSLFGGVSLREAAAGLGMVLLTALTLGCISLWISARARSTRGAVAGAYALAALIAFLSLGVMAAEIIAFRPSEETFFPVGGREIYSSWINPYIGMVSAVGEPIEGDPMDEIAVFAPVNGLLSLRAGLSPFTEQASDAGMVAPQDISVDLDETAQVDLPPLRPRRGAVWVRTVAIYGALSLLALFGATRRVSAPDGSKRAAKVSRAAA
jgi:hypothetical protein